MGKTHSVGLVILKLVSKLVGALSPVNHRRLHQGYGYIKGVLDGKDAVGRPGYIKGVLSGRDAACRPGYINVSSAGKTQPACRPGYIKGVLSGKDAACRPGYSKGVLSGKDAASL